MRPEGKPRRDPATNSFGLDHGQRHGTRATASRGMEHEQRRKRFSHRPRGSGARPRLWAGGATPRAGQRPRPRRGQRPQGHRPPRTGPPGAPLATEVAKAVGFHLVSRRCYFFSFKKWFEVMVPINGCPHTSMSTRRASAGSWSPRWCRPRSSGRPAPCRDFPRGGGQHAQRHNSATPHSF